jgi:hypothetical protein
MTHPTPGTPQLQAAQGTPQPPTANQATKTKNDRKSPRRRVLKEGKLIFGQGHSVVDCVIDNESAGGAHVRVTSSHGVPEEFYLAEATRGIIHRAEVAWRTTTGIGLKILGPVEDVAQREAFLRKFRRG